MASNSDFIFFVKFRHKIDISYVTDSRLFQDIKDQFRVIPNFKIKDYCCFHCFCCNKTFHEVLHKSKSQAISDLVSQSFAYIVFNGQLYVHKSNELILDNVIIGDISMCEGTLYRKDVSRYTILVTHKNKKLVVGHCSNIYLSNLKYFCDLVKYNKSDDKGRFNVIDTIGQKLDEKEPMFLEIDTDSDVFYKLEEYFCKYDQYKLPYKCEQYIEYNIETEEEKSGFDQDNFLQNDTD